MEALRACRLDPRRQGELREQIAQADRGGANLRCIVFGRIEVEYADIRVLQVGDP